MDSEPDLNEVTEKVKEYAELSKTIKVTQEKLKVLNKKKKELYKEVVPKLKNSNITKCNLPYGTLKVTKVKRKVAPTKTTIKDKYIIFFNTKARESEFINGTPEERATILYNFIYVESVEFKEEQSISMTYTKEFREQFKELKINN